MEMDVDELFKLKELIKWKNDNPEEYKFFLIGLRELLKDMKDIANELK